MLTDGSVLGLKEVGLLSSVPGSHGLPEANVRKREYSQLNADKSAFTATCPVR